MPRGDRLNAERIALLEAKWRRELTPTESARLKYTTERLRKIWPRVTRKDWAALDAMERDLVRRDKKLDRLMTRLGIE